MSPLLPVVLSVLVLASPSRAAESQAREVLADQRRADSAAEGKTYDDIKAVKDKYKYQRPAEFSAAFDEGLTIGDLRSLMLRSKDCAADPEDASRLAPDLKGKFGLVSCRPNGDLRLTVLTPKSVAKDQQLAFVGSPGEPLVGGRLIDHYFVIEYEKQKQYLDLRKATPTGFTHGGVVDSGQIVLFEEAGSFVDALKNYAGIKDAATLSKISAEASKAANGKPCLFEARKTGEKWLMFAETDGRKSQIWAE